MDMQNHYDNAGNLVNSGSAGHVFVYDALSQVVNVDQGNTASYTYNGMDERVAKKTPTGWTDYAYLNGQPMAEESNRGVWTDYIYANGKKIARVSTMASLLHLHGYRDQTNAACGVEGAISGANLAGLTIVDGDALVYDSQQTLATYGGVALIFTDGTGTGIITDMTTQQPLYFNGQNDGQWHHMAADLSQFAGETVDYVEAGIHNTADMGTFDMALANVAVVHANATVTNVATATSTVQNFNGTQCGGQQLTADAGLSPVSALVGTYYYVDDHLGTAQMEFNASGFTTWQGQFTPYGQEVINGTAYPFAGYVPTDGTTMPFKFTGKERDTESGLDYFGARYYTSNMGRWMSPDPGWFLQTNPDDPQTWNQYAYVLNSPTDLIDPDGFEAQCTNDGNGHATCTSSKHDEGKPPPSSGSTPLASGDQKNPHSEAQPQSIGSRALNTWLKLTSPIDKAAAWGDAHPLVIFPFAIAAVLQGNQGPIEADEAAVEEESTYLYQKLSATGAHLKYGITDTPLTRYNAAQLAGGRLKLLASGTRNAMLALERSLHATLPIGPEEGQPIYKNIQAAKGYKTPPY